MRRYFQFTLRFALIGTALVAILLSIYVNGFQRGRRFVAAIEARDGAVTYPFEYEYSDGWRKWLSRWLGEGAVFPIEGVSISGINDDDLLIFRDAQGLQKLEITEAKITKEGVARLAMLKDLHRLRLESDSVTVRDLEPLAQIPGLEHLDITVNGGTEDCVRLLKMMPRCDVYFWARQQTSNEEEAEQAGAPTDLQRN